MKYDNPLDEIIYDLEEELFQELEKRNTSEENIDKKYMFLFEDNEDFLGFIFSLLIVFIMIGFLIFRTELML